MDQLVHRERETERERFVQADQILIASEENIQGTKAKEEVRKTSTE